MRENQLFRALCFKRSALVFLRQRNACGMRRLFKIGSAFKLGFRFCVLGYFAFFTFLSLFGNSLHAFLPHCHDQQVFVDLAQTTLESPDQICHSSWTTAHEFDEPDCPICSFFLQYRTVAFSIVTLVAFQETPKSFRLTLPCSLSKIQLFVSYGRAPPVAAL